MRIRVRIRVRIHVRIRVRIHVKRHAGAGIRQGAYKWAHVRKVSIMMTCSFNEWPCIS